MHPLVALVTVVALMLFAWQGLRVGSARSRFGVEAPATTGHPDFERHFRVHANTLEGLMLFLPSLWLFALAWGDDRIAAAIGAVWIVGRVMYLTGYSKAAASRGPGFGIQALATGALLFGALGKIIWIAVQKGV